MSITEICLIIIAVVLGLPFAIALLLGICAAGLSVLAAILEKYEKRKRARKGGE